MNKIIKIHNINNRLLVECSDGTLRCLSNNFKKDYTYTYRAWNNQRKKKATGKSRGRYSQIGMTGLWIENVKR